MNPFLSATEVLATVPPDAITGAFMASSVPVMVTLVETIRLGGASSVTGPLLVMRVRGQPLGSFVTSSTFKPALSECSHAESARLVIMANASLASAEERACFSEGVRVVGITISLRSRTERYVKHFLIILIVVIRIIIYKFGFKGFSKSRYLLNFVQEKITF